MLALLLSVTALALSPVLLANFIALDDYSHLVDNPNFHRPPAAALAAFWSKSYFSLYIPVTYSVWWALTLLGNLIGGLQHNAWLLHAFNLAVHLANVTLVFLLVRTLLRLGRHATLGDDTARDDTVALIATFFFAIHPVQIESVAWISELKGELAAMFGLLGLSWYYRSAKRLPTAVFFVAAMLSKPSAIVFPVILVIIDRIILGRSVRKSVAMPALYSVPLLILVLVTKHLQPDSELDFIPTAAQRFVVAADAFAFYVCQLLVPNSLAVDYGHSPRFVLEHTSGWWQLLSGLLLAAGTAAVVKALVRPKLCSRDGYGPSLIYCGGSVFLLSIAPVLGFVPFGFQEFSTVADHYLYVALFGVTIMVAGALVRVETFANARGVAAAVLVVFAGLSFQQARLWQSTEVLFGRTVKVNPQSYLGYYCIAEEHMRARRLRESIPWLEKSLAINPNYVTAEIGLGLAWAQAGEIGKAIEFYNEALAKNPSIVGTRARPVSSLHNNYGMLLLKVGLAPLAADHFRKAVEIFPLSVNGHLNLANMAFAEERYADAIAEYEIARSLSPGNLAIEQRLERARQSAHEALPDGAQRPSL